MDAGAQVGMAPPFTPELWNLMLEYLPIEKVVECKTVSSELGVAARFALTKGRWKPVAESVREFERWTYSHAMNRNPCYAAAWVLDPELIMDEVEKIHRRGFNWNFFLAAVEPSIDGFGRVIKGLERFAALADIEEVVAQILLGWLERVSPSYSRSTVWTRLWRELERWSDGWYAGRLLASQAFIDWFPDDYSDEYLFDMTDDWTDTEKREALIEAIAEAHADFGAAPDPMPDSDATDDDY